MISRYLLSVLTAFCALPVFAQGAPQIRIMPLGDSLTSGVDATDSTGRGGYRTQLESRLLEAGIPFDFVGLHDSAEGTGGGALGDPDHEGWGGYSINGDPPGTSEFSLRLAIQQTQPVAATSPDIVLVMAGTNNVVWTTSSLGTEPKEQAIASDINALYNEIYAQQPNTTILAATIPPANPNSEKPRAPRSKIIAFNQIISENIAARKAMGDRIELCDIFSSITAATTDISLRTPSPEFSSGSTLIDGVHPTTEGYRKIGDKWYQAIQEYYWKIYPLYLNSKSLDGGWRSSPSFGDFYDNEEHGDGWRFHKNLGWFWGAQARKTDHLWMWLPGFGWVYSSAETWPNIYRQLNREWYFIDEDSTARVYHYAKEAWEAIPQ